MEICVGTEENLKKNKLITFTGHKAVFKFEIILTIKENN